MKPIFIFLLIFILAVSLTSAYTDGTFGDGTMGECAMGEACPEPTATTSSSSSSSGSGRSGSGSAYTPPLKETKIDGQTISINLAQGDSYKIIFKNGEEHNLILNKLYSDRVIISLHSVSFDNINMYIKDRKEFELDNVKISLYLKNIIGGYANFEIKDLTDYSVIPFPASDTTATPTSNVEVVSDISIIPKQETSKVQPSGQQPATNKSLIFILIIFAVVVLISAYLYKQGKKKDVPKEEKKNG